MSAENLVFPDYQNNIVNISATLATYLGQPTKHASLPVLTQKLAQNYQNVVYLVIDAMGSRILMKNLPARSFLRRHQVQEVTTVFPSTTPCATTTILTAQTPAEHGWLGWAVDFDGAVVELFANRYAYTHEFVANPNFIDEKIPIANFFDHARAPFTTHAVMPDYLRRKLATPDCQTYRHLGEMCQKITALCHQPGPKFIYAYFCELDSIMHHYGTTGRPTRRLLVHLDRTLARLQRRNPHTLFVITADHGQLDLQGNVLLYQDQAVMDCLLDPPAWEPRGTSFRVKPGCAARFEQAFHAAAPDFLLYRTDDLLRQGVFGGQPKSAYRPYFGDYIAVGTQTNRSLIFQAGQELQGGKNPYFGQHTGATADEMFVPLILAGEV